MVPFMTPSSAEPRLHRNRHAHCRSAAAVSRHDRSDRRSIRTILKMLFHNLQFALADRKQFLTYGLSCSPVILIR